MLQPASVSSLFSLTSALDGGGWSTHFPPAYWPPEERTGTHFTRAVWTSGPVWMVAENLALTGILSLNRSARNESLYGLRYPGTLASYFISNKVVDGGNILFVYYYNKIHNGALYGVYLDSCATSYPQLPSFNGVVRNPRYWSDFVLNQINPVPTFKHVSL